MKLFLPLAFAVAVSAIPSEFYDVSEGERFIIGGVKAAKGEMPYQLSLQSENLHICGASLIGKQIALTSGSCVTGAISRLTVVAGTNKLNSGGDVYHIKEIVIHPGYNVATAENDIALIVLLTEVVFKEAVQPVPIVPQNFTTSGDLLLSGWGSTFVGGPLTNDLMKVVVPFVSDASCRISYAGTGFPFAIRDSMLCAGCPEGGKGACLGDSGVPLVNKNLALVGILSFGQPCARPNRSDVFTEVSYFTDWINAQVKLHT